MLRDQILAAAEIVVAEQQQKDQKKAVVVAFASASGLSPAISAADAQKQDNPDNRASTVSITEQRVPTGTIVSAPAVASTSAVRCT